MAAVFQPVNPSDGSGLGGVSGIVTDPENGLWFSDRGIIHIREAQLHSWTPAKWNSRAFGSPMD